MAVNADLENLYSPSAWSKRLDVENDHCQFAENESLRMRNKWPNATHWFGAKTSHENFDVYGTHLPNDAPIFVYVHGGYWQMLSKETSAYCADPLVENGCKVIIMNFELCPTVTVEQQINQSFESAKAILNYAAQFGARCVNFAGHSSGGHLLLAIIHQLIIERHPQLRLIQTLYPLAGVYDLNELRFTNVANKNNVLSLTDENVRALSPLYYDFAAWSEYPFAIKIFVGQYDSPRFIEQSKSLQQRIFQHTNKNNCTFDLIENYDHFDIVNDLSKKEFLITKILIHDLTSK